MTSPADRKNQLVWDQIEAGQFKQALQLCNRRIKKGEKNEMLLILKTLTLSSIPGAASHSEAVELARSISNQTPPVSTKEALRLLSRVWTKLGPSYAAEITALWERAVKSQPNSEDLAKEWFFISIRASDWRGAQKAAMTLQTKFNKRREYYFWAIVSCLMLHNTLPENAAERKLFGTLAYRMIDKARNDTPADTTVIPARGIQTGQEVNLLLELIPFVAPGDKDKLALEVLNSKNLGVDSTVGKSDWWGLARRRLDLLESLGEWKTLYETCKGLLPKRDQEDESEKQNVDQKQEITGRGDDWRVWKGFVDAAGKLYDQGDKDVSKEALEQILEHRKFAASGSSRNGDLALVKFASLFHDKNDGPEGTSTLQEAIEGYFDRICTKTCCFEDLQEYLEMLEDVEQKDFLRHVGSFVSSLPEETEKQKIDRAAAIINQQKFIYLLNISLLNTASDSTTKTISNFVTACLKIYTTSLNLGSTLLPTDNQYGDDAALLSIMGLIRLYTLTPTDDSPLYQSIIILETLLQKSKHNYQALLILVRLYLLTGAITLATTTYPRLNIKQIQNDTLSHFLLTRISTLLPADPKIPVFIDDAVGIYESNKKQTPNMLQLALERGSYAQMLGFLEFSDRVAGSISRSIAEIEHLRLSRLAKIPHKPDPVSEIGINGKVWDQRDFEVVLNCERSKQPSFESTFRVGATPRERWVRAFAAVESVIDALGPKTADSEPASTSAEDPATTITASLDADALASPVDREFTAAEIAYLKLISTISEILTSTSTSNTAKLTELLDGPILVNELDLIPDTIPGWELLHTLWMAKDSCTIVGKLVGFLGTSAAQKVGVQKQKVAALKEAVERMKKDVDERAKEAVKSVGEDDEKEQRLVDKVLAEEGVGRLLRKEDVWGGVERCVERVKRVRESAAGALKGVYA